MTTEEFMKLMTDGLDKLRQEALDGDPRAAHSIDVIYETLKEKYAELERRLAEEVR